jgi:PASTA domain
LVQLRLGIGGKALGLRGGISTRGVGIGAGPFSAGSSWRGRRSRKSGGGLGLFFIALILAPVISLCGHHHQPSSGEQAPPTTYVTPKAAPPPLAGACPTTQNGEATGGDSSPKTSVTLPALVGLNAQVAEDQLKSLGLKDSMSSANPKYKMVLVAKNWTVVDMYPPAGCVVSQYDQVDLNVTKP